MRSKKTISRREFLYLSGVTVAGVVVAGCQATVTPAETTPTPEATKAEEQPTPAPEPASAYKEAPDLADSVAAGSLSPVDERLPEQPTVIEPIERIGDYGGEWSAGEVGGGQRGFWTRHTEYEQLLRWTPTWDGIMPCLAKSYEANDEATEFTFSLFKGIKWSDGEPFTADDMMFWYEDVLLNEELTPKPPGWLVRNGEPVALEKLDDYTVKFTFAGPNGLFLKELCIDVRDRTCVYARHYWEELHSKYNPDIDQLMQEEGYSVWAEFFDFMSIDFQNSDMPVMYAWELQQSMAEATTRVVAARNPYYWKIDPEGKQLPYIDRFITYLYTEAEALLLKVLNGEIDYEELFTVDPKNKAVLADSSEKGGYHFITLTPTRVNEMIIMLNMNCTDPVKREMFRNKDFRIGLSHAIDRQEIIDVVHVSQGEPWQAAPRPESRFHHEVLAKQYTEHNLDLANEHLDKAGYGERDSEGYRVGPDGERASFIMEIDVGRTTYVDALELIKPQLEAVGVEMIIKTMERSLWEERCRSRNLEFHATAHRFGGGAGDSVILDPRYWFPSNNGSSCFAKAWAFWYNNPTDELGEEPPEEVKKAMALYDEIAIVSDDEKQFDLMMQILDIAADQFYAIGTVLEPDTYAVVSNRLQNVPPSVPNSWIYPTPAPYNTCQFFIEE